MSSSDLFDRLARLRVDRSRGEAMGAAPHKPLLLLTLADMAEAGELTGPEVVLSPAVAFRFAGYWPAVVARRQVGPDVRMPFHHLTGDGLAEAFDEAGRPSGERNATAMIRLDGDLYDLLTSEDGRRDLRRLMVGTYFPDDERAWLGGMLDLPELASAGELRRELAGEPRRPDVRVARFRVEVVAAYDYRCALTGRRLLTVDALSLVEAAHIHRFADGGGNATTNGLALTRDAHALFDMGLWTLSDTLTVDVAGAAYAEDWPTGPTLASFAGQPIMLPRDPAKHPDPERVDWHRANVYLG